MAAEPTKASKREAENSGEQVSQQRKDKPDLAKQSTSGYAGLVAALARKRRDSQNDRDPEADA